MFEIDKSIPAVADLMGVGDESWALSLFHLTTTAHVELSSPFDRKGEPSTGAIQATKSRRGERRGMAEDSTAVEGGFAS
jgi:hypothetical protein